MDRMELGFAIGEGVCNVQIRRLAAYTGRGHSIYKLSTI